MFALKLRRCFFDRRFRQSVLIPLFGDAPPRADEHLPEQDRRHSELLCRHEQVPPRRWSFRSRRVERVLWFAIVAARRRARDLPSHRSMPITALRTRTTRIAIASMLSPVSHRDSGGKSQEGNHDARELVHRYAPGRSGFDLLQRVAAETEVDVHELAMWVSPIAVDIEQNRNGVRLERVPVLCFC